MVNITKFIRGLEHLKGTSARMTLGKKQVLKAVGKENPEIAERLAGMMQGLRDPKFDVAYKVSDRGYNIAAVSVRDGKKVVGNGAVSITGAGTENTVIKARMNIGKNGEIFRYSGYDDLSQKLTLQDLEYSSSLKKGVLEVTENCDKYGAGTFRLDIPKATEALGLKEEGAVAIKKANNFIEKCMQKMRDLFAGKEVDFAEGIIPKSKVRKLENVELPDKAKDLKKAVEEAAEKAHKADYVKVPSGKDVAIEEFQKVKAEYLNSLDHAIKHNTEMGNHEMADKLIKEKIHFIEQADEITKTKTNDWTDWLRDNPCFRDLFD